MEADAILTLIEIAREALREVGTTTRNGYEAFAAYTAINNLDNAHHWVQEAQDASQSERQ